jgi:hypothetical protein
MTSTRLRQIAQLIESQCIELRTLKRFPDRVACNQCKAAVVELCEFARDLEPKSSIELFLLTPSDGRPN